VSVLVARRQSPICTDPRQAGQIVNPETSAVSGNVTPHAGHGRPTPLWGIWRRRMEDDVGTHGVVSEFL
jgi:hypothetical protein